MKDDRLFGSHYRRLPDKFIRDGNAAHQLELLQRRRSSDVARESWQIPLWPFQLARFFGTSAQGDNVHRAESDLIQPHVHML